MTVREQTEKNEHIILAEFACFADETKGREQGETPCELRTEFQRDRDRIIHSRAFRRLKHKTQVFLAPESDHYRTRLTHTLEVAQISRTVARALRLNEDLTEAIALGHDLGHTPFGHAGERAINELVSFDFTHYKQSERVCKRIEKGGKGLNLTYEVLDGIRNHTTGEWSENLEGRVVRFCDRIAYINHDIEDAQRAGIISEKDIPKDITAHLGSNKSARISHLVRSLVQNSSDKGIVMDAETEEYYNGLHSFLFEAVYKNPIAKSEESKVKGLVEGLFEHYLSKPEDLPIDYKLIGEKEGLERAVADYISGMTDHFATAAFEKIFVPKFWSF